MCREFTGRFGAAGRNRSRWVAGVELEFAMQAAVRTAGICATQGPVLAFEALPSVVLGLSPTRPSARDRRRRGRFASAHPLLFR